MPVSAAGKDSGKNRSPSSNPGPLPGPAVGSKPVVSANSAGVLAGFVGMAVVGYGLLKIMALARRRLLVWHQETAERT